MASSCSKKVPICPKGRTMDIQKFLKNRQQFPLDELARRRGEYVAWSPDGTRIVASSPDLEALEQLVRAAGEDPQECTIEGIPDYDAVIGGGSMR